MSDTFLHFCDDEPKYPAVTSRIKAELPCRSLLWSRSLGRSCGTSHSFLPASKKKKKKCFNHVIYERMIKKKHKLSHCSLLACSSCQSLVPETSHMGIEYCQPKQHWQLFLTSMMPPPYLICKLKTQEWCAELTRFYKAKPTDLELLNILLSSESLPWRRKIAPA